MFEYKALNSITQKEVKGTLDADSAKAARAKLKSMDLYATDLKEVKEGKKNTTGSQLDVKNLFSQTDKVSLKDLSISTRQLATLITAGLPLVQALQAFSDQTESKVLRRILVDVREKVEQGSSLSKAMQQYPKAFPRLYTNMIASAEASGTLDTVLTRLADYLEAQLDLSRKVSSALFYPALMFGFCSLVVIALLAFVVPSIVQIFEKQNAELPTPTKILIGISSGLTTYWPLVIIFIILLIVGINRYYNSEKGRSTLDALMFKLPVISPLYQRVITARIAMTLGSLLSSGVGLLQAIDISKNVVGNVHVKSSLDILAEGVREGRSLAKELSKIPYFPPLLSHMVSVGEQSGTLDVMLLRAGTSYDKETESSINGLTRLIEPLMIMLLGVVVLAIVIAILLPIVNMVNIIQR